MFRLLGFFIGSATSIVIILLIIGMPTFNLADHEVSQQRYDAAIEKLKAKQDEFESMTGKLSEDVARVAETVESGLDRSAKSEPEALSASMLAEAVAIEQKVSLEQAAGPAGLRDPEPRWYSFWNPFRSEIAANGFVSQLERVTGIDYRVVKVRTGVYEVAFAYMDDSERRSKLTQIAAATGLDLPDS